MSANPVTSPKSQKYWLLALVLIMAIVVIMFSYRVFFEFSNSKVSNYINAEAKEYADKDKAAQLIHEAVMHILSSRTLTNEVRLYAKSSGLEKERVLVDSAKLQCQALNYL